MLLMLPAAAARLPHSLLQPHTPHFIEPALSALKPAGLSRLAGQASFIQPSFGDSRSVDATILYGRRELLELVQTTQHPHAVNDEGPHRQHGPG